MSCCNSDNNTVLSVKSLFASYGKRQVLTDISFTLNKSSLTGLLGANGSGKSTLLKTLCGFVGSYEECIVNGQDIKKLSNKSLSRLISYIPQRPSVTFSLSVTDIVLMGFNPYLSIFSNPDRQMYKKAMDALVQVGLYERRDDDFLALSEGQKQLCILARTIVQDTPLMLLDEPDSALDFSNRRLLIKTVKETVSKSGKSALLCSHDPALSLEFCDSIILLSGSKISGIISPKTDSEEFLTQKLSQIYGKVDVFRRNGKLFMSKEDD